MDILEMLRTPLSFRDVDGVDLPYHPNLPIDDLLEEAAEEISKLRSKLPTGMEECTLRFKECKVGHGTLTATNWVQHECRQCEIQRLREALEEVAEGIYRPGTDPWDVVGQMRDSAKAALGVKSP